MNPLVTVPPCAGLHPPGVRADGQPGEAETAPLLALDTRTEEPVDPIGRGAVEVSRGLANRKPRSQLDQPEFGLVQPQRALRQLLDYDIVLDYVEPITAVRLEDAHSSEPQLLGLLAEPILPGFGHLDRFGTDIVGQVGMLRVGLVVPLDLVLDIIEERAELLVHEPAGLPPEHACFVVELHRQGPSVLGVSIFRPACRGSIQVGMSDGQPIRPQGGTERSRTLNPAPTTQALDWMPGTAGSARHTPGTGSAQGRTGGPACSRAQPDDSESRLAKRAGAFDTSTAQTLTGTPALLSEHYPRRADKS